MSILVLFMFPFLYIIKIISIFYRQVKPQDQNKKIKNFKLESLQMLVNVCVKMWRKMDQKQTTMTLSYLKKNDRRDCFESK